MKKLLCFLLTALLTLAAASFAAADVFDVLLGDFAAIYDGLLSGEMELVRFDGGSMYPTLQNREVILLDKRGEPKRFDVIVCRYPDTCPLPDEYRVKRIIGMPGDVITYAEDGCLCVNGVRYEEPYVLNRRNYGYVCERLVPVLDETTGETRMAIRACQSYTVPEDKYFVLGDYRSNSMDSHVAMVGDLGRELIVGRVIYVIMPAQGMEQRVIPNGLE